MFENVINENTVDVIYSLWLSLNQKLHMYIADSVKVGYWAFGKSNKAMISLSEHQTIAYLIAQFLMPEATFIEPAVHGCNVLQVLIVYM